MVVKETLELLHLGLLGHGPLVWSQLALIDFIELLLPKKFLLLALLLGTGVVLSAQTTAHRHLLPVMPQSTEVSNCQGPSQCTSRLLPQAWCTRVPSNNFKIDS